MSSDHAGANPASRAFGALSNATRRDILRKLTEGDAPAHKIAEHFELGLPSIYKHIRVLRSAGLVTEQVRGREKWYAICRNALDAARAHLTALADP